MGIKRVSQARKRKKREIAFQRRKEGWYRGQQRKVDKEWQDRLARES